MENKKRVFLIVLDSFGIGEMPDAKKYGDEGSNTLAAIVKSKKYKTPNLEKLGLFNIEGVDCKEDVENPQASFARLAESSNGKDTTTGHWEMAGIISEKPFPTFPNGFPEDFLEEYSERVGRKILCNKPYSGTEVIKDYGKEHLETGALIVYTSADSVFQVAGHEDVVSLEELYRCCEIAREMLQGDLAVGRVIARPFVGKEGSFERTRNRHDYALDPTGPIVMDDLVKNGFDSIGVGKIYDIFAGKSVEESYKMEDNIDGMNITLDLCDKDFNGLCFVNLVDFDMIYGHRNDVDGYANAASEFDKQLGQMMDKLREDDIVIITADHGCDPSTESTDHSREYVPMIIFGDKIKAGVDLKTRNTFADIGKTVADIFGIESSIPGTSFYREVRK
ncbi:phosphopentomutase [Anaerococcus prevotii]|uniref:Phosphopentomutase n=1 Tax=Anaerococcus prevotii ACS-065-V-Col13 TaxID=879305 RepID=F0GW01_9FIRM|nr:phosphopentomutase [Anaerococcus prevotii]EGC81949.1 phosphopentomutase [Anaerococcus prevotii ACS-065-V-Col13]